MGRGIGATCSLEQFVSLVTRWKSSRLFMYLGASEYRIHGTNDPTTIGKFVSSGCIRLTNEDVTDLFSRVSVGTRVVVLPKNAPLQPRNVAMRPAGSLSPFSVRRVTNVPVSDVN